MSFLLAAFPRGVAVCLRPRPSSVPVVASAARAGTRLAARGSYLGLSILALLSAAGCGDRPVFGRAPDARAAYDVGAADVGHDARIADGGLDGHIEMIDAALDAPLPTSDVGLDGDVELADVGLDASAILDGSAILDAARADARLVDAPATDAPSADARDSAADAPRRGPAPVLLGSASDLATPGAYVLIGKTGVTNVTGSMISGGHVGVSPAAATAITGLSLILDPSNVFATSVAVVSPSRVYAADYAEPTPTNLTSAIAGMELAYTDAASRSLPDFLDLMSGNLGGLTLAPGLYTFGSSVSIPADVTFSGGADDVWILQVAGDLDVSAIRSVIVSGGARASNIFWQVAGTVTIHAGAHVEGILLCQTGITMETGASLHGRALAQSLIALDDNAITAP